MGLPLLCLWLTLSLGQGGRLWIQAKGNERQKDAGQKDEQTD